MSKCFICNGDLAANGPKPNYLHCRSCSHEILIESEYQGFIINAILEKRDESKLTKLEKFKLNTLEACAKGSTRNVLLDIGSADGRFLQLCESRFDKKLGLEITPKCVDFSRKILHLDIVEDIAEVSDQISVATAWHSLEHIPISSLIKILEALANKLSSNGVFIVSVPNSKSFQYNIFGRNYAYYDVPNHIHQFSPKSLELLLAKIGFKKVNIVNSVPYNIFGYVQGILNLFTSEHNYLYYKLKRGKSGPSIYNQLISYFLLPFAIPLGVIFGIAEGFFPSRQGVITICFIKV